MQIDYNDLMQAVAAEDEPAVAKILNKLTTTQLADFRIQLAKLLVIAKTVQRNKCNKLDITDRWYPK